MSSKPRGDVPAERLYEILKFMGDKPIVETTRWGVSQPMGRLIRLSSKPWGDVPAERLYKISKLMVQTYRRDDPVGRLSADGSSPNRWVVSQPMGPSTRLHSTGITS